MATPTFLAAALLFLSGAATPDYSPSVYISTSPRALDKRGVCNAIRIVCSANHSTGRETYIQLYHNSELLPTNQTHCSGNCARREHTIWCPVEKDAGQYFCKEIDTDTGDSVGVSDVLLLKSATEQHLLEVARTTFSPVSEVTANSTTMLSAFVAGCTSSPLYIYYDLKQEQPGGKLTCYTNQVHTGCPGTDLQLVHVHPDHGLELVQSKTIHCNNVTCKRLEKEILFTAKKASGEYYCQLSHKHTRAPIKKSDMILLENVTVYNLILANRLKFSQASIQDTTNQENPTSVFTSDVDECTNRTHNCDKIAICKNNEKSFTCKCPKGYTGNGTTGNCLDVDECTNGTHNCDKMAVCKKIEKSFTCECPKGYTGDGTTGNCLGSKPKNHNVGLIAGSVVGGFFILGIIVVVLYKVKQDSGTSGEYSL